MTSVYVDSVYMNVWEENLDRDGERTSDFEPDFNGNNSIRLGDILYIDSRAQLKEIVEKKIFREYCQFKLEEFTCVEDKYGWDYEGFFVMDGGRKIKADKEEYTHIIRFSVEVKVIEERNAFESFKLRDKVQY